MEEGKDQKSVNQVPHLTLDTVWENGNNIRNHHIQERAKRSALSKQVTAWLQGTDKTVWQVQTQITKTIHKSSTALERSLRKLLEGLNMLHSTILTLTSDVAQDT